MSLYEEYEEYTQRYKKEYGLRTVVLYRCGSFYEIYSINDGLVNIKEISELLNIQVSRRNKSILQVDRTNCNMAGFPMFALKKFMNILLDNSYTVVIVDQISEPPKPKRAVTEIISPGTRIDDINTFENNMLLVALFEEHDTWRNSKQKTLAIGVSIIDLTTGKSKIAEFCSKEDDRGLSLDELFKTIIFYNPREIVLLSEKELDETYTFTYLVNYLEISKACVHDKLGQLPSIMTNISYQDQLLRKVYPNHGLLSVFEYLEIERLPLGTISYIYMLDFAYKHNENIIQQLSTPEILESSQNLVLSYNTCKQLNITELSNLLNQCITAIGKRNFRERLTTPMINQQDIEKSYNTIETYLKIYTNTSKILNNVYDLERLYRKMILKRLHPADFMQINQTLESVIELSHLVAFEPTPASSLSPSTVPDIPEITKTYKAILDMQKIEKYHLDNIVESFFNRGIYQEIDEMNDKLVKLVGFFDILATNISDSTCKVDYNERDGYYLTMTAKRYQDIKAELKGKTVKIYEYTIQLSNLVAKSVSASSNIVRLSDPIMKKINEDITILKEKLSEQVYIKYQEFVERFVNQYDFESIIKYISEVDWFTSCAKNAVQYKYIRPQIVNATDNANANTNASEANASYMEAKALRHPIIETILTQTEYIPNDISIGTKTCQGILLYGINSAGKSSISKALGLCIIMAQAGMFVPCKELKYYPYNEIFTRIPSGDDMMKGQSTFVVEITELRNILKRAGKNSLVIGDELASGTESVSALAIVSAGILQLYKKNTSFIFATHLHDLCDISHIKNLENLGIYHLSVRYDVTTKKLIYDRTLQRGQGNTLYGLEVCKSLNLGEDFLEIANGIRQEILEMPGSLYLQKQSRYNAQCFIDVCGICKKPAKEVHHIKHQAAADENGFIDHIHKNKLSNLVAVCESCHDKIHNNSILVEGYQQTSAGIEMVTIQKEDILKMRENGMTYKEISDKMNISIYKIRKVIAV